MHPSSDALVEFVLEETQRNETVKVGSPDSLLATTSPSSRDAFNRKPENLKPTPWSEKMMSRGVLSLFHWLKNDSASSNDETICSSPSL